MNKLWKQLAIATNWPVIVAVAVLSALGLVSIWAHSLADVRSEKDVQRQLMYVAIGVTLMCAMQAVNYLQLGRWGWPFYILSLLLLIYTIIPGVPMRQFLGVVEVNGAKLWINLGILHVQPAELMKVAFCVVLARYLRFRSNYRTMLGLLAPFGLAVVPLLIILKQPDLGTHAPEAHNDMVFALTGEQSGFLGALVLVGAYLVLFAAGIEIAAATKEPFGRLVAVGIVSLFAGQTFLNLMVTLKLMPVTGITLPFVSYGGSRIIAS